MEDIELTERDAQALQYLGKAYLKVPWVILSRLQDIRQREHRIGLVHLMLFACCNYEDRSIAARENGPSCKIGEFHSTYEILAGYCDLNISSFRRYIKALEKEHLVEIWRVDDASCFHVNGYAQFMASMESQHLKGYQAKKKTTSKALEKKPDLLGDTKPRLDLLDL